VRQMESWEESGDEVILTTSAIILGLVTSAPAVADEQKVCTEILIRVPANVYVPPTIERRDPVKAIHTLAERMREDRDPKDKVKYEPIIVTTNYSGLCRSDGAAWSLTVVPTAPEP
jgi:hypothetical protein